MDAALIDRARAGDRAALEQLLENIAPLVHRFGLRMCRHQADADDVLQDTLLSVSTHLNEFEGRSSLASWVFMLARTACARRRRGLKNQPHVSDHVIGEPSSPEGTPEQAAGDAELRQALERALDALSSEHREVLVLRDMEGLSAQEVADSLGISVQAVKSRLHRARATLREGLRGVLERGVPASSPDCPDVLAAFSRKLEGDLGAEDCAAMEQHLASCRACGAACTALRTALWACRAEAQGSVSPEVQARVTAAIRALGQQASR
jgi:RNA polymerase sigma-70 factor (ECF subfamily)